MKTLLTALLSLSLLCPLFAGPHNGCGHDRWSGGNHWGHERHEGWRGNHHRFAGFGGTFYGQIIILDDGCYFWNGLIWEWYGDGCE